MKRPGYTIAELLIYISIVSIVFVVFTQFMTDATRVTQRTRVAKEVNQNARQVMARIVHDVRGANDVAVTGTALQLNGGTIQYDTNGTAVLYTDATGTHPITTPTVNVTGLTFVPHPQGVTVTLTVQGRIGIPGAAEQQLQLTDTIAAHRLLY